MKLSGAMQQRIEGVSVAHRHLHGYEETTNHNPGHWWENCPSTWSKEQAAMFDMVYRIEADLKDRIIEILKR